MMVTQHAICFVMLNKLEHEILTLCGNLQTIAHEVSPSLHTFHSSRQINYNYIYLQEVLHKLKHHYGL